MVSARGTARLLFQAIRKSAEDHAKDLAAAIAYWSFFSIFPLVIAILSVAGYFLGSSEAQVRVYRLVTDSLPGSADFVQGLVTDVVEHRGTLGLVGLLGLLWTASKGFGAVTRAVNRAVGAKRSHPFSLSKLRHLLVTAVCSALLLISLGTTTAVEVVLRPSMLEPLGLDLPLLSRFQGTVTNLLLAVLLFAVVYKITPYVRASWGQVLPGALLAALLFEVLKAGFVVYLERGTDLEALYGSLSSIIVLLLWLYLSAWVLILGAEFNIVRFQARSKRASEAVELVEAGD